MSIFDEPKIDCHLHIFDPHRFPYREDTPYRPTGQEIGTAIQFRAVMQAYGVPYALLVGPNSGYGFDNRCMLDAIAQGEGRFKGVGVVPNDVSAARLAELKAQGVLGVTVNVSLAGVDHFSQADTLFNRLADLDMFAQVQYEKDQLLGLLPLIGRTRARLLIDHSGRPDAAAGLNQPGFQALLDTFGPEGCLWASDWPFLKAPERLDYGPLLRLAQDLMPDPRVRRQVMWETPRRLFGFGD
ncbi:amidohydrolase family protein [Castellaniella hirudinis]|uniref:Amidohydrolase family protein n=1 Tax=Castellaniella hirudinis TaxID=1144617 RepID=A0ABV8S075_9BURK